jgi:hypothetical protein
MIPHPCCVPGSLNLYDYLKERNFRGFNIVDLHHITRQLLSGLSFIHQEVGAVRGDVALYVRVTVKS